MRALLVFIGLLFASAALAQTSTISPGLRACAQQTAFSHTAATGPIAIVPGVSGQSVWYCGFVIAEKGNTLDLKVWASAQADCSGTIESFSPQWSFPGSFAFSTRVSETGLYSPPGYSLCIQTFGAGALTGVVYWTQQ
jgi:hypothetical protein